MFVPKTSIQTYPYLNLKSCADSVVYMYDITPVVCLQHVYQHVLMHGLNKLRGHTALCTSVNRYVLQKDKHALF